MKQTIVLFFLCCLALAGMSQGRNINKLTLETTYSYTEIHKSLRDLIDKVPRENYFNDDFFNNMLKKIILDKQFSIKEKVQVFYLMQKKLGYAFVGVNYLPPKQNYFIFHLSKILVLQKTRDALHQLKTDPSPYLEIADTHKDNDPIIASNALLLASLLNSEKVIEKLHGWSESRNILTSKNPVIYNHYLCLSSSLLQDSVISGNLRKNLLQFKEEGMIEDVFCALYSRPNPVASIKEYILQEKNPENDLAIQTGLCALYTKVIESSFKQSVKSLLGSVTEPWKTELLNKIASNKIPFNYSLSSEDQLVSKTWDAVQVSIYNDGTLISNNTLLEFDPN
jgi:hypothetical protein